ncbi:MAG TPA: Mrp/NBP35 family ATP-binding protein [Gammaproteobacteria bacterium]|nr:Mrp/NBP35 family ATP-binding protein [Gammaproteobacteria bacterium]
MFIENKLKAWTPPGLLQPLYNFCQSWSFAQQGETFQLNLEMGFHYRHLETLLRTEFSKHCSDPIVINIIEKVKFHQTQNSLKPLSNIKNIIAVSSAKGGVGKSSISAAIAKGLAQHNSSVGLLDADIYGSNIPSIFNLHQQPEINDQKQCIPIYSEGVHLMSIGLLMQKDTPMIWRGPMVTQAYQHLLTQTAWPQLDYLIIDMPPGTGDIQLTLTQKTPLSGCVIITTPEQLAVEDSIKGIAMFNKMSIPVLGLIENMTRFHCESCHTHHPLFKESKTHLIDPSIERLGDIPWSHNLGETQAKWLGLRVASKLSLRPLDTLHKFPNVVVS